MSTPKSTIDGEILDEVPIKITERTVQLKNMTLEDAQDRRAIVAAKHGVAISQVQLGPVDGARQDRVKLRVIYGDPFKQRHEWKGVTKAGANIIEVIEFATAQDTERTGIWLPGDASKNRNAEHFLTMGMTGTGKTKCWQCIYAEALNRTQVSLIYADPAKGIQSAWPLLDGIEWFADNDKTTKEVINSVPRAIRERVNYLGSKGLDEWVPDCGLNYLVYHFEEIAGLANRRFVQLSERARSAGISLVLSLQRASGDRMNTSVRFNLGGSLCFGCKQSVDTRMALMDTTIDAGANPHIWQSRHRGQFYLEASGIATERFAIPHKVDHIDLVLIEEEVRAGARFRTPLDNLTAGVLGPGYERYRRDLMRGDAKWQAIMDGRITANFSSDDSRNEDIELGEAVQVSDTSAEPPAKPTTTQCDDMLIAWINELQPGQAFTFGQAKADLLPRLERSETWLNLRLKKLITLGKLPEKQGSDGYRAPMTKI